MPLHLLLFLTQINFYQFPRFHSFFRCCSFHDFRVHVVSISYYVYTITAYVPYDIFRYSVSLLYYADDEDSKGERFYEGLAVLLNHLL
jgi:hypothetical protein